MEVPSRGVLEDNALEQHILTTYETDHDGTEEATDSLELGIGLGRRHIQAGTYLALGITLGGYPIAFLNLDTARSQKLFPMGIGYLTLLYRAPILAITIDGTLTRNGDIGSAIGRKGRLRPSNEVLIIG